MFLSFFFIIPKADAIPVIFVIPVRGIGGVHKENMTGLTVFGEFRIPTGDGFDAAAGIISKCQRKGDNGKAGLRTYNADRLWPDRSRHAVIQKAKTEIRIPRRGGLETGESLGKQLVDG